MARQSAMVARLRTAWNPSRLPTRRWAWDRSRLMARVDAYEMPKSGRIRNRPTNAKAVLYSPNGVGPRRRAARKPRRKRRTFDPSPIAEKKVLRARARATGGAGSDVRPPAPCGAGHRGPG